MDHPKKINEKVYQTILETTGASTIIIEKDMSISFANAGFEKLTGYTKEEIQNKMKWTSVIASKPELEQMIEYHRLRRVRPDLAPTEYEFVLTDRFNNRKHIFLRVDIIPGTDQSIASLIDITSLKQTEKALKKSQSRLNGILEAFEGFIYTCTRDYKIEYMNKALKQFIKSNQSGHTCFEMIYGLSKPCQWCHISDVFSGKTVKTEFLNPKDNRWYYAVDTPVLDVDDTVIQKQSVIIDIHQRKTEEEEIKARDQYLKQENIKLRSTIKDRYRFGDIVGKSPAMQKVYELILRASATNANVIVYGESGTGKELVARAIHENSDRKSKAFIPVNCGAIPHHLLESEFFGYKKGAFTGASQNKPGFLDQADQGTLFLDEIGEIDLDLQVKLLRAIEGLGFTPIGGHGPHKPDIRIISATNRNLKQLVEKGQMREDFFYRIHIIPIDLPPVRQRKEDIPLLIDHFLRKQRQQKQIPPLTGNMIEMLLQYDWPGNVRELENTLQRFADLNHIDLLGALNPKPVENKLLTLDPTGAQHSVLPLRQALDRFEKEYIITLLNQHAWNRTKVAQLLNIERKTLYLKIKKLGISNIIRQ